MALDLEFTLENRKGRLAYRANRSKERDDGVQLPARIVTSKRRVFLHAALSILLGVVAAVALGRIARGP
jgi:hypothetical protein